MSKSPLLPIFLIVAVDVLGLTIIIPLLPFYAEHYGASPQVVGILITSYAACQFIAGPILGRISDRIGRKPLLLVSQFGTLVGFLILAFAHQLWLIFLSRIIDGITAGNLSLAQAYIADHTEPQNRAKAFGMIGVSFGMGFLLGPAISGFLASYGYQYPVFAAATLSGLSILATAVLLPGGPPPHHVAGQPGEAERGTSRRSVFDFGVYARYFKRPELAPLLWQFLFFSITFSLFISGFALFAERRFSYNGVPFGPKQVGYMYAYAGLLGLILQGGLIGRLVKRFGERKLVISGFFCAAVGYILLGFTTTLGMLLLVTVVTSYGTGVLRPAITSLVTQAAGRREQGVVLGLNQSLNSIAQIFCPILSGALIGHYQLSGWAFAIAVAAGMGFCIARKAHLAPAATAGPNPSGRPI